MRYKSGMRILAIETSCDETAVCIIEAQGDIAADFEFKILGNALYSQIAIHALYGGVFPNLAKREHAKNLIPLLTEALAHANYKDQISVTSVDNYKDLTFVKELLAREEGLYEQLIDFLKSYPKPDVDAIAVTKGPGLEPALWVGVNLARALSIVWGIPIVGLDHMEGHIMMSLMDFVNPSSGHMREFEFPLLALLISGGHTELVHTPQWMNYEVIGQTRDDAVGEAFDKVARLLGFPYPGGPAISQLAALDRAAHPKPTLKFTPPMLHSDDLDFSFSGIKTEVRKFVDGETPDDEIKMVIARAFEDAVTAVLVAKTLRAVDEFAVRTVVVGGGVSANTYIREQLGNALARTGAANLLVPPPGLATDNAVMIALPGYFHAIKKDFADPATLRADGNLKLAA
jgi:N6-L-threonylcarbamoyladenine synthase